MAWMNAATRTQARNNGDCMNCACEGIEIKATHKHFNTLYCDECWSKQIVVEAQADKEGAK